MARIALLFGLILFIPFGVWCGAIPEKPLIFIVESVDGTKSCLIALTHLSLYPAEETEEVLKCERNAHALVLEADPSMVGSNIWHGYERQGKDLQFSDLSRVNKEKISPALKKAKYSDSQIEYFLTLHPIAIYRALMYSPLLDPKLPLKPNLDIRIAAAAKIQKFKIIEMEGMPRYFQAERELDIRQIDLLVSVLCDLVLNDERLKNYLENTKKYIYDLDSQPDVDTAWKKKLWFNTVALGLPTYTMSHDVDNRNPAMAKGILNAIKTDGSVLIMIGSAHVGGPLSVLDALKKNGLKVTRQQ